MQYTASDFRAMARQNLRGKWGIAILVTVVASMLGLTVAMSGRITLQFEVETGMNLKLSWFTLPLNMLGTQVALVFAVWTLVWQLIVIILNGPLSLGYYRFHQDIVREENLNLGTLFAGMKTFGRGFCLMLLQAIYTFLWMLCLIVPGIMAMYSYAMTYYIANDHPEMTAKEAITASKEMMKGNRWRLFCLEISFIGWEILGAIPLGLGSYVVAPYRETARALFYQDLCQKIAEQEMKQNTDTGTDQYVPYNNIVE